MRAGSTLGLHVTTLLPFESMYKRAFTVTAVFPRSETQNGW